MRKCYYYDSTTDARRALLTDIDNIRIHHTRLIIRDERGQGALLLNKTYTTHRGARAALARRGSGWTCYKKVTY